MTDRPPPPAETDRDAEQGNPTRSPFAPDRAGPDPAADPADGAGLGRHPLHRSPAPPWWPPDDIGNQTAGCAAVAPLAALAALAAIAWLIRHATN